MDNERAVVYTEIPCDKCGEQPTTRWYGDTCLRLCSNSACYEHYDRIYKEMMEEDDEDDSPECGAKP
jgi:hypothetical protein